MDGGSQQINLYLGINNWVPFFLHGEGQGAAGGVDIYGSSISFSCAARRVCLARTAVLVATAAFVVTAAGLARGESLFFVLVVILLIFSVAWQGIRGAPGAAR